MRQTAVCCYDMGQDLGMFVCQDPLLARGSNTGQAALTGGDLSTSYQPALGSNYYGLYLTPPHLAGVMIIFQI